MAHLDTAPPPYSTAADTDHAVSTPATDPPAYLHAVRSRPRDLLPTEELPTLIMKDCFIYARDQPETSLYEISNPPTAGKSTVHGIEKFTYKLSRTDGEGTMNQGKRHLYDMRTDASIVSEDAFPQTIVKLDAKASSSACYRGVVLTRAVANSWSSCKATGYFAVSQTLKKRLSRSDQLEWKDADGRIIAIETRPTRGQDGAINMPPQLMMVSQLEVKDLDLLVTLWASRLWKESEKLNAEPFSWSKFKRIATTNPGTGGRSLARVGGFV